MAAPDAEGDGRFQQTRTWTFTSSSSLPPGLSAREQLIGATGPSNRPRRYEASNVRVHNGFLELVVPGGQRSAGVIGGAAVSTDFPILYASVRTYAILSPVPGVVNGMYFYRSDAQEIDIEWVSDGLSPSNLRAPPHHQPRTGEGKALLHYTNQALDGREAHASRGYGAPPPSDAFDAVHEYRIDWAPGATRFYLDGVLQVEHTTNVPELSGRWNWNCWSNGNPGFSMGPPETDAVFRIREIVMHYNPGDGARLGS